MTRRQSADDGGDAVAGSHPAHVTLVVRRPHPAPPPRGEVRRLSRAEFARRFACATADVRRVERFVRQHRLEVVHRSPVAGSLVVGGSREALEAAFPPRDGGTRVPAELAELVEAVLGLDCRPAAHPHLPAAAEVASAAAEAPRHSVDDIAALYCFPESEGAGVVIGVIALAGGYRSADLEAFFASLGRPLPVVVDVGVDHGAPGSRAGANRPASAEAMEQLHEVLAGGSGDPSPEAIFTFETTMDVELVAGFAPAATVVVYFAPSNDEEGFYHALAAAVHDQQRQPSVISLSWGWMESQWEDPHSAPILPAVGRLLEDAEALGVTFCASSGDEGAGGTGDQAWVQFPASSHRALACGGSRLEVRGGEVCEVAWSESIAGHDYASGGGVSRMFERPEWQHHVELPGDRDGRGVPDVCGVANRSAGARIVVAGHQEAATGTSAVAPMWAGLVARMGAELGSPLGCLNARIYRLAKADPGLFQDIVKGSGGDLEASVGWDPMTGLGSPHGRRLAAALGADLAAAETAQ